MRRDWWTPLTGVAFVVLVIVGLTVGGEPPDVDEGIDKVVSHYQDNKDSIQVGAALSAIAASLFVWFGATLRDALRDEDGTTGITANVVFAGTIITAVGAAIDSTISIAIAEAVDDVEPAAVQALQALWDNDFMPLALGIQLFLLASGLAVLRRPVVPKWLGWIAVALGILGLTPVGFVAFLAGGIWVIAVSIILTLRNRAPGAPPAEPQPVGVTR